MKHISKLLRQPGFDLLLFYLALAFFSWPFFAKIDQYPEKMFNYIFLPWGITVFILFLMSQSLNSSDADEQDAEKE
jgi:hypothetical protein